jgi:uncharacterized protein YqgC (DUF456 family)
MTFLVGVAIAVGLVGVLVPVLPGAFLVLGAIAVWAFTETSATGWSVLAVAIVAIGVSQVVKYVVPGRRLRQAGIPNTSMVVGGLVGIVGFFVVPVVGLFLGFPLGVYVAELQRLGRHQLAWPSMRHALGAVGLSILIELAGTLLAAGAWLTAVVVG